MPFVQGFLKMRRGGGNIDNELPGDQPGIDNSLPGYQPGIDNELPSPPPGIWPPPNLGHPIVPVDPGFGIPVRPGTIWPSPGRPPHVDVGLPGGGLHPGGGPMPGGERPGNVLPQPPGQIDNTLPSKTFWMLCYCPSLGWKFIAVDPSLEVGMPLPPAAQPK